MEDRIKNEMEREGISEEKAFNILKRDDEQREKWSTYLYGINTQDPSLYDLVIHINRLDTDDAVDIICNIVSSDKFKTTPQSQKNIDNLALAAEVKAALIDLKPDIRVSASDGIVSVFTKAHESEEKHLTSEMKKIAKDIPGVKDLKVSVRLSDIVE
jgi:hypothetical protein